MLPDIAIYWFRQDLRVGDNPGLLRASQHGAVMPIYISDYSDTVISRSTSLVLM